MALFLKFVLEFLEVQRLVFPKFLILRVCGKSFLNECISMTAWVVLSLPTSWSHLYGFCWCMPRKEVGDTWRRSRCLLFT